MLLGGGLLKGVFTGGVIDGLRFAGSGGGIR